MRAPVIVTTLLLLAGTDPVLAGPREQGSSDTRRHSTPDERTQVLPHFNARVDEGSTRAEQIDPAVQQYWSRRCVEERRFGFSHSKDCDNPAYTGGYGAYDPYRGYAPYPGQWGRPYRPRRGGIIEWEDEGRQRFGRHGSMSR